MHNDPTQKDKAPDEHESGQEREVIDASAGYEKGDIKVTGILVFLTAMGIFVAVAGILAWGIGKAINAQMAKDDGPQSKWAKTVDVRPLGNLASNPELLHKVADLTQGFPAPRVQTDDGLQDLADLHAREDLLLDHYTWANQAQGKVRIPIDRAMELVAQRGLPVADKVDHAPLLTGDVEPTVAMPLTNGFVRTGFEQEQAAAVKKSEQHK
jgi:hypothetical protein